MLFLKAWPTNTHTGPSCAPFNGRDTAWACAGGQSGPALTQFDAERPQALKRPLLGRFAKSSKKGPRGLRCAGRTSRGEGKGLDNSQAEDVDVDEALRATPRRGWRALGVALAVVLILTVGAAAWTADLSFNIGGLNVRTPGRRRVRTRH